VTSIYERALGSDFQRLHPNIQRRFGFGSDDGIAAIGRGVMDEIWRGPFWTVPFLTIGSFRSIMFPERGKLVPFTIENYSYRDSFERETVTWIRTFEGRRTRRFDAYMIYSEPRKKIIDYLGTHQHLAVDLDLSVDTRGGLLIQSGSQRLYEGTIAFPFPLLFSGVATVCEWFDDDEQKYRIEVGVTNRAWGRLFGYRGRFDVEYRNVRASEIPNSVRPKREERRE
jgi:Domain of unknown function (DUF4166)